MKRRFGRGRRRNPGSEERAAIDAAHWMARIVEAQSVPAARLEPAELDDVPDSFAALGLGEDTDGRPLAVGFAPERAADAALAVLALGARRRRNAEPDAALYAVAPDWSAADRRRLGLLAPRLSLTAVASSPLASGPVTVSPEAPEPPRSDPRELADRLARSGDREIFARALTALDGLAAKHGGALRGVGDRVELVVLAQRTAALVAEPGSLRIEVSEPDRATLSLGPGEGLATALDRLEGSLRKLLNDRRQRSSEAGLRAALLPVLERAAGVVAAARWPLGGGDGEPVDTVGLLADGGCVVGASRETLDLPALARILDAATRAPEVARELGRRTGRACSGAPTRLALAATEFEPAVLDAGAALGLEIAWFDARTRRGGEWSLEARSSAELDGTGTSAASPRPRAPEPERPDRSETDRDAGGRSASGRSATDRDAGGRDPAGRDAAGRDAAGSDGADAPAGSRGRSRRGRSSRAAAPAGDEASDAGAPTGGGRFEEVSLFDLDEETSSESGSRDGEGGRRRRGRGRRRGRRGRGGAAGSESGGEARPRAGQAEGPDRERAPRATEAASPSPAPDDDDDDVVEGDDGNLAPLAEGAPDLDESEPPGYEDEEEEGDDDPAADRARRERELRRRARAAEPAEPPRPPRRRAAFLAHADPVSVLTAVVLARDVRLVESFWVYPQDDLMRFFRNVATDLRDQTPIFLVGFAPARPAHTTFQTAGLYRGRLDWFDHHEWPPEDLEALRATLGEDHVHVEAGAESSLAAVITGRTRRSRFSDKLVELVTGRFSQHDFERWGRWWWHRVGEIAAQPGEHRAHLEPLLAGRPSDLARAAASAPEPPVPPELAYVSEHDFRLVHFGGFTMVVLDVPPELDLHLSARIARERYDAQLSLASYSDRELAVLGGDDSRGPRGLDLGGLTAHLATKHVWIDALADDDHVARMRVQGLHSEPGRFDDLVTEIAMGRSIVEG